MKLSTLLVKTTCLLAFFLSGLGLQAVPLNPTFTFKENGRGMLELPNGAVIPLLGNLASDPGPGGLLSALAFATHPQEGAAFFVGDLLVTDGNGNVSDLLRFTPATTSGTGLTQLIFFYSNDAGGFLADTGLPGDFYANSVLFPENENGATIYTPVLGQPGFLANAPLPITYQIFSTPDTGSTLLLFAVGLSGLAFLPLGRRRT